MLTDEEAKLAIEILSGDNGQNTKGGNRSVSFHRIYKGHSAKKRGKLNGRETRSKKIV